MHFQTRSKKWWPLTHFSLHLSFSFVHISRNTMIYLPFLMSICDLFILNGVACNLSPVQFTQQQSSFNSLRKLDHKTLSVWFHSSNGRLHSVRHSLLGDGKYIWKNQFLLKRKKKFVDVCVCRETFSSSHVCTTCITFKLPYLFGCGTKVYSFICRRILSRHFSLLYTYKM